MPKNDSNTPQLDPMALMAMSGSSGGGMSPELQAVLAEYLKKSVDRMNQEDAEIARRKAERVEISKNWALHQEQVRKTNEMRQQYCTHKTADGRKTQLGGQRLPGGKIAIRCQTCQKLFNDLRQIPGDLVPSSEYIGGPNY